VVSGRWSVVSGQWSVVGGQWSVVGGQWSVALEPPDKGTINYGPPTTDHRPPPTTTDHRPPTTDAYCFLIGDLNLPFLMASTSFLAWLRAISA